MAADRYNCSFVGTCEVDPYGPYQSEEECIPRCRRGQQNKEVTYLMAGYTPEGILALSPSDQRYILRSQYGVPLADAGIVLPALRVLHDVPATKRANNQTLRQLFLYWAQHPEIAEVMANFYTPEEYLVEVEWSDFLLSPGLSLEYYTNLREEIIALVPAVFDAFNKIWNRELAPLQLAHLLLPRWMDDSFRGRLSDWVLDPESNEDRAVIDAYRLLRQL